MLSRVVSFRVSDDDYVEISNYAFARGMTVNQYIRAKAKGEFDPKSTDDVPQIPDNSEEIAQLLSINAESLLLLQAICPASYRNAIDVKMQRLSIPQWKVE